MWEIFVESCKGRTMIFCLNYCPRYREILVQKAKNSLFFFGVINLWKSGRKGNQCFVYFCNVEATRESDPKKFALGSSASERVLWIAE